MKRFILILPGILLFAVFIFFYLQFQEERRIRAEQDRAAEVARKTADDARKAEQQRLADEEAKRQKDEADKRRQAEQEAERRKKEDAERVIVQDTESALAKGRSLQAQIAKLQTDISAMRIARDKAQKEAIDTKLDIENYRVQKRNAEIEIQRYTDMLAKGIEQSIQKAKQMEADALAKKK